MNASSSGRVWGNKRGAQILLWIGIAAYAACWIASLLVGHTMPFGADLAFRVAVPLLIALWVAHDARVRGVKLWYDFDTCLFFAWPVLLPYYVFRTRGVATMLKLIVGVPVCVAALKYLATGVAEKISSDRQSRISEIENAIGSELDAYKLAHGQYPKSLNSLSFTNSPWEREILWALPTLYYSRLDNGGFWIGYYGNHGFSAYLTRGGDSNPTQPSSANNSTR